METSNKEINELDEENLSDNTEFKIDMGDAEDENILNIHEIVEYLIKNYDDIRCNNIRRLCTKYKEYLSQINV